MKNHAYIYIATLIIVGVLSVNTQAQSSRNMQRLRVSIPFAFNAGDTMLPAGKYRVHVVNPSSDRCVLQISGTDGTRVMIKTMDVQGSPSEEAKLTFKRYGDQYFLTQVWMAAESSGFETPTSKAEKSLRRQLGPLAKNYEVVAINAR
ncbi:MAG TPA: hypothetical protein VGQ39_24290 [Pyrinomonadaceae bacterium]|jgi:hypothetical protein|nr:hypothetical protein [Pyrinomonadaceae bacterium]